MKTERRKKKITSKNFVVTFGQVMNDKQAKRTKSVGLVERT